MKLLTKYFSITVFVAAEMMIVACGSKPTDEAPVAVRKDITSQKVGNVVIALQNETGELVQGQDKFILAFNNANGKPVDVGKVTVGSSMAMPGMAPMVASIELRSAGRTGIYYLSGNFAMSGTYTFDVRWDGPA